MSLADLGWDDFFITQYNHIQEKEVYPARVIRQLKKTYWIHDGKSERRAVLAGRHYQIAQTNLDLPAVGDWVAVKGKPEDDQHMIRSLLPRKSQFVRKVVLENTKPQVIAANIDTVFIVNGLDRDFNLRRIERYLSLTYESSARPVIILNKMDLCEDTESILTEVEAIALGAHIFAISATTGDGIEELMAYLKPACTVAFIGSSGVGKSTLVNLLMGDELMPVQEVRKNDQRGRHTTTHREMFILSNGAMIIDTPGLRELQMWGSEDILSDTFTDIEEIANACRFSDCRHDREPGCAVKSAVDTGEIDAGRYENYLKLKKELTFLEERQNDFGRREARRKTKIMSKMIKRFNRDRDKR